ncbi:long-chain fatty acid--CoA ligase [Dongia soli]|uniref:Long-chain fatty acid--CoA ligase n=1 Tax=Dongia soli TaxID=600628 RepID=A0ABU5E8N0_9PROT|nr:long-chain fatty acid--CoA ligase [Dongia soli]MDY0882114.1 long-chain fatty acid--CoA ligase [Dongia soli]
MSMAVRQDLTARPWLTAYPPNLDWATPIEPRPLYHLLDDAAARFGTRPCIDFLDRQFTYAEIKSLSDRAAKGLQQRGLQAGMRLGLFLPNCPYYVIFYYAALKCGATVVNFNPLYVEREVEHQIADSQTDMMVTLDLHSLADKLEVLLGRSRLRALILCPFADSLPFPKNLLVPIAMFRDLAHIRRDERHIAYADLIDNDGAYLPPVIDPLEDIALLQYTGGTTGVPKGAALSHANVYVNALQCRAWFANVSNESARVIGVLPLFHAFAMTCVMNWCLTIGGLMILLPRFDAKRLLSTIDKKRPTAMPAVPTLLTALLNRSDLGDYDLRSLEFCISGGAPLPLEVRRAFEAKTGARVVEGYGLSEASPVTCCNPVHRPGKTGSIGLPLPLTDCVIVSLDDRRTPVKPGEVGEICFRGPQVMLGYWNRPEATDEVITDGLLHTGDVGHIDEEGFVFITDRLKEMINASGYKVYPRVVEEAIYQHPAVKECAVIGVGDHYRGQTVKAFVSLKTGQHLTAEVLQEFLSHRLSKIEMPKLIEFRAELPKTVIGKIQKKVLIEEENAKSQPAGAADPDQNKETTS